MEIKKFEDLVKSEITSVIESIVKANSHLNISAKSRAGAEISDWLENKFVEATKNHPYLKKSEGSPKGKTKNPWDARTFFSLKDTEEEIWIDFKAFKLSGIDSNPDIGTPNKIIKFVMEGGFYLLYIHLHYEEEGNGMKFVKMKNGNFVKSYFLKDISPTFRRTPTNQLQVNMSAEPVYRTREEFINLLMEKVSEGLERQLKKAESELKKLNAQKSALVEKNITSEKIIEQIP
jgi:hypothetical protein